jgi:hypothetical protein
MLEDAMLCRASSEGVVCAFDQATRGTRLPPAILPLALPLNLVQAVLRARGIIVSPGIQAACCQQRLLPTVVARCTV